MAMTVRTMTERTKTVLVVSSIMFMMIVIFRMIRHGLLYSRQIFFRCISVTDETPAVSPPLDKETALWSQAIYFPLVYGFDFHVSKSIMQSVFTALPKFPLLRHDSKTAPEVRHWNLTLLEF